MTRLFFLILFIVFLVKTNGQTYVPMPMQNCYWQMTHSKFCSQSTSTPAVSSSLFEYQVYPNSDTIIAAKKYIKFYSQVITNTISPFCSIAGSSSTGYWGAVRQDTAGKKIYLIYPNQTNENLLYNFNYVKGDSVKTVLGFYSSPPPGGDPYRIIDSIYYQSYNDGICRKTFRQKTYQYNGGGYLWTQHNYFTEGIGNEVGLNERDYLINISSINFASQEQWSSLLTINNFTISRTTTNTCPQNVGIKNLYNKNEIKIFPNPASTTLFISTEQNEFKNSDIEVMNYLGQIVLKTKFKNELDISELPNGIFIIQLKNSQGQVAVKRLVVSK